MNIEGILKERKTRFEVDLWRLTALRGLFRKNPWLHVVFFIYIDRRICTRAAMLIRMEHTRSLQRGEPRLGKCNRLSLWRQPQSAQTYLKGGTICINKKGCHFEDSTRQHAQLKMSTPQPHHGIFFLYHAWDRWSLWEHKGI